MALWSPNTTVWSERVCSGNPLTARVCCSGNYIDQNTIVHRKSLVDTLGGFDEQINRLQDWDLMLRYTELAPAKRLPVLATLYRSVDDQRLTDTSPYGPDYLHIKRKLQRDPDLPRHPRVLYVLRHYPQLNETYIETEIRYMLRHGVHVEVWTDERRRHPLSAHPCRSIAARSQETIARVRPDVLHVHWLSYCAPAPNPRSNQFRTPRHDPAFMGLMSSTSAVGARMSMAVRACDLRFSTPVSGAA